MHLNELPIFEFEGTVLLIIIVGKTILSVDLSTNF